MKILVINRGSSSVKLSLYEFSSLPNHSIQPLWSDLREWNKEELKSILSGIDVDCIGHRVVHGGTRYRSSVLIDRDVKQEIKRLSYLAPLHNLANLEGIVLMEQFYPGVPQVAVFDTAFHHTLPPCAMVYPGPYEWVDEGIMRYGFHGINYQYCVKRSSELLGHTSPKMVICHLGSGSSLCAVKEGKSVDTTMGFTPLEGLVMGTRSGTVDPGILLHLLKKKSAEELSVDLYERSGLFGLSGSSPDMRVILEKSEQGDERAKLALDVFLHRAASLIGSMVVSLSGLDTLVFTGGIGENSSAIRTKLCERLSFLGITLAESSGKEDRQISQKNSQVKVLVIHAQEAFEIARECFLITKQ